MDTKNEKACSKTLFRTTKSRVGMTDFSVKNFSVSTVMHTKFLKAVIMFWIVGIERHIALLYFFPQGFRVNAASYIHFKMTFKQLSHGQTQCCAVQECTYFSKTRKA